MADAAALRTQLEELQRARRMGARRARVSDRVVEFRSDAEMRTAILDLMLKIRIEIGFGFVEWRPWARLEHV